LISPPYKIHMSRAGKFIPGGVARKTVDIGARTEPIRATTEAERPAPEVPKRSNRLFNKGAGFVKTVPKNRRLPIVIMSSICCCLLVSYAWYEVGVVPAKRELAAEQAKEAADQKQLADAILAQKAQTAAQLKQQLASRATITVDSKPASTVTIGDAHKQTPATFDDVLPGDVTVLIQAPGYEDSRQELTVSANKPTDLGTIQLVPQLASLSLSTPEDGVEYTLTGPNGYTHSGQMPEKLENLAVGDYQLSVRQGDWQLPLIPLTLHDRDALQKEVPFPYGSATITSSPSGATIRNGNSILGQTPLSLARLHPGEMNLSADLFPYTVQRFVVNVPNYNSVTKQLTLIHGRDFMSATGVPMVWIPDGFWAGKYDVTQRVFENVMDYNPSTFRRPDRPVETVSWANAMAFCEKLNQEEAKEGKLPKGYHYTLPTESQWETFSADADINLAAMSRSVVLSSTQDVGASEPNKYGLYDTLGNVWQWCLDDDGQGDHSLRGGNWLSSADNFPSADTRSAGSPKDADRFTGFRVVLVPM